MQVSDFDYYLPGELIAQEAAARRASSRMLQLDRRSGRWEDRHFGEFPDLLRPDDLLVLNNTRVFPARLYGHRSGSRAQTVSSRNPAGRDFLQGTIEVLLTEPAHGEPGGHVWNALVHPGRKIGIGERLFFGEGELEAEVIARGGYGERTLAFKPVDDFFSVVERIGHVPLPPYISRDDQPADRDRYQTVYARERGSVAAPTAGLHFTPEILERIRARGTDIAELTLHVGLGTFQPVRVERVGEHRIHSERFAISEQTAGAVNRALDARRRVVAVGTTTVRTLEFAARKSGRVTPGRGEADLFIYPGFQFRVVSAMLTNFHLPKSSLLMLVSAFGGKERVLTAYQWAV